MSESACTVAFNDRNVEGRAAGNGKGDEEKK